MGFIWALIVAHPYFRSIFGIQTVCPRPFRLQCIWVPGVKRVAGAEVDVAAAFAGLDNASVSSARLGEDMLRAELQRCEKPYRVVVSGPAGYNGAVKKMLENCGVEADAITILSA